MKHMGFSDLYLFSPLYEKMEGVDIRKAYRLINDYSLDFFDHYLKQQPFSYWSKILATIQSLRCRKAETEVYDTEYE